MRSMMNTAIVAVTIFIVSCQSSPNHNHEATTQAQAADTQAVAVENPAAEVKPLAATFTNVDSKVSSVLHEAVTHYFHVKNALVEDKTDQAKAGAEAMLATLGKLDKSYFTADQKKAYDAVEKGLKEHASQLAATADIKGQRAHFVSLSNQVYELVKAFGAGKTVYHDYCPMADNDKGALWVSEVADIRNPYFGSAMLTCGSVEEKIN